MLIGEFRHSIDAKNRVFLPAKWRAELGEAVVITMGLNNCLYLWGKAAFEEKAAELNSKALEDAKARAYSRVFFAKSREETVDAQGRITIPATFREAIGIGKEVVLAGTSLRAEIWSAPGYDAYLETALADYESNAQGLVG